MDLKELKLMIEENDVTAIDLKYCDTVGMWRHLTLPIEKLDYILKYGLILDHCQHIKTVNNEELVIIPDIDTAVIDDNYNTISIICTVHDKKTAKGAKCDPRSIALRAKEYLASSGIADESCWIPELRFYAFDEADFYSSKFSSAYQFTSIQNKYCLPDSYEDSDAISAQDINARNINSPLDSKFSLRQDIVDCLIDKNIKISCHSHDDGLAGQQRIMPELMPFPKAADAVLIAKDITKHLALEYRASITFMPKPIYNEPGSGMHFHVQLKQNNINLFYEKGRYADLSHTALYFIGGILQHGASLAAFTNPSTNSYRRLFASPDEPSKLFYGFANKLAAISVPKSANTEEEKRIEIKFADATSNPYLAMSAILMAGLDGIKNQIHPNELGYGPYEDDINQWSKEMQDAIKSMPNSLEEALNALKADHQYLLAGNVFDKDFIKSWIDLKMKEVVAINQRPHPYEMTMYYNL
ncbi:MAG: glutamine synthetase beta-grasp domain-containing protein [Candidatus Cloacimonadales bacterium]|nr:glutamine synthetase beta-grasp domain-containing protein [Candidatus Cloacimonadota bacterium]MDX9976419.1 glutamine synthetase beta-grasp domain-containing protein [Candidatus Cloacimonadales bacterium]